MTTMPAGHWFHDTVSALAYSLAQPHGNPPGLQPPYNDLTRFILDQHARMPDYLCAPMLAATLGFDLAGLIRTGSLFHSQPPELRSKQTARWKKSGLGIQRDLIRYFESLATLALYSRHSAGKAPVGEISGNGIIGNPTHEIRAEIVVIGSGPGGAITASLLAEAGRNVLLVEEGPYYSLDSCAPFSLEEMIQKYRNGGQTVTMGRNKIAYVEGRCVGGGSEINSGLYHRTPPEVLERWRKEFGVAGMGEADLEPHFLACELDLSVSLLPCPPPAASLKLHEGAIKLGWKSIEVPRWFSYDSDISGKPQGVRQSMTKTFLPRFLRAGGRLLPRTRAVRIRQNGAGWVVAADHDSVGRVEITANQLFLCAGAVQSPALLRASGITQNIGNSLQVHPTVKIIAQFADEVNSAEMGVPVHQVKEFAPRVSFGCSIGSTPYLALGLMDHPQAACETSRIWRNSAIYYAMITSEGRGSVRKLLGFRDPLVRYSLTRNDRRNLADGMHKLSQILFEAGAISLYPNLADGHKLQNRDCLLKLPGILRAGQASLMTIHLFSSCPMGEDRSKTAANSFGCVHGFSNLFVNDASLLCTAPGVNPQGSVMAVAHRNTLAFLHKL